MQPKLIWKSGIIDVRRTENRIEKYLLLNMLQITLAYPNIDSIVHNPSIVKGSLFSPIVRRLSILNSHQVHAINFIFMVVTASLLEPPFDKIVSKLFCTIL